MKFYGAIRTKDYTTTERLIDNFFLPCLASPSRKAGYAVRILKAVASGAGPVRPPLSDLTGEECEQLDALIKSLGPQ